MKATIYLTLFTALILASVHAGSPISYSVSTQGNVTVNSTLQVHTPGGAEVASQFSANANAQASTGFWAWISAIFGGSKNHGNYTNSTTTTTVYTPSTNVGMNAGAGAHVGFFQGIANFFADLHI
jgi:hypothetical protein